MATRPPVYRAPTTRTVKQRRDDHDRSRRAEQPWRSLYKTARWLKARAAFLFAHPLCIWCAFRKQLTPATVVDHWLPHRGDAAIFWDSTRWAPLCATCHSSDKQRLEAKGHDDLVRVGRLIGVLRARSPTDDDQPLANEG